MTSWSRQSWQSLVLVCIHKPFFIFWNIEFGYLWNKEFSPFSWQCCPERNIGKQNKTSFNHPASQSFRRFFAPRHLKTSQQSFVLHDPLQHAKGSDALGPGQFIFKQSPSGNPGNWNPPPCYIHSQTLPTFPPELQDLIPGVQQVWRALPGDRRDWAHIINLP